MMNVFDCKCPICPEHDDHWKNVVSRQKILIVIWLMLFFSLAAGASYMLGSMTASLKLQREAVNKGYGVYEPVENWNAFKWKD